MVEFEYQTVISGAGISISWPSSLPSGDDLADLAWARLLDLAQPTGKRLRTSFSESARSRLDVRLEHFMELCAENGMGVEAVESVYRFMGDAKPNDSHHLLAALPEHTHLTVNVDTLLEQVGVSVVHLHGQVDRPGSVMTTVSQYMRGLPPELEETLFSQTRGKDVLAVGYSGRDLDVFPTIVRAVPKRLRWLRFPGSPRFAEVDSGLQELRRAGCAVDDDEGTLEDFVASCVRTPVTVRSEDLAEPHAPTPVDECFAGVPSAVLRRTIASALFDSGALSVLDELDDSGLSDPEDLVHVRKLRARSARQQGETLRALRLLAVPPAPHLALRLWRSGAGEVSSLLARSGHPRVSTAVDRLLLRRVARRDDVAARRAAVTLRIRLAQRASVAGRLSQAAALIAPIVEDEAAKLGSTTGEVDALTWALDILKAQGRFPDMQRLAARLEDVAPFGNSSQKAFAYWQLGQVSLLQGAGKTARAYLEAAEGHARAASDGLALTWIRATSSDAWRGHDDEIAAEMLHLAFQERSTRDPLAEQYLHIQAAEHARYLGELTRSTKHLQAARAIKVPGQWRLSGRSLNALAIETIELWRDGEQDPSRRWLRRAQFMHRRYEKMGAHVSAADVTTLVAGATRIAADVSGWSERGWLEQVRRAQSPWSWRSPWRVIA